MMTKSTNLFLGLCFVAAGLGTVNAQAPDDAARDSDRQGLRALAARYETAISNGDLMSLQDSILPDASAVFMTGDEVSGVAAMQAFLDRVRKELGDGTRYSVKLNPGATRFEGEIASAHGTSDEKVIFGNGREISYQTKWTALLKKVDGKWFAMRLHVSLDPINNPIIELQSRATKWLIGGGALIGGILLGMLIAGFRSRPLHPK